MGIADMIDEIERIAKDYLKPYEVKRGENGEERYWVDVITGDLNFGALDGFTSEVAQLFNIERSSFHMWAPKEDEIAIGFFLPYHKSLSRSEAEHKFIYVEVEFREYFPPWGEKFLVQSGGRIYEASLDEQNRIFLRKWFEDNPGVKPSDITVLWALTPLEKYALKLRKRRSELG